MTQYPSQAFYGPYTPRFQPGVQPMWQPIPSAQPLSQPGSWRSQPSRRHASRHVEHAATPHTYTPLNNMPLKMLRPNRPFSMFKRTTAPDPPPTKLEFYWENLNNHFVGSYLHGAHRYLDMLRDNPLHATGILLLSAGLGAALTTFHRHFKLVESAFILGALSYPIYYAVRWFPKMDEAYDTVVQGNPKQGEAMFKEALDESVYKIFHCFLKPLTIASIGFVTMLRMPETIRRIGRSEGWLAFLKPTLESLKITDKTGPLAAIDAVYQSLRSAGDRIYKMFGIV